MLSKIHSYRLLFRRFCSMRKILPTFFGFSTNKEYIAHYRAWFPEVSSLNLVMNKVNSCILTKDVFPIRILGLKRRRFRHWDMIKFSLNFCKFKKTINAVYSFISDCIQWKVCNCFPALKTCNLKFNLKTLNLKLGENIFILLIGACSKFSIWYMHDRGRGFIHRERLG